MKAVTGAPARGHYVPAMISGNTVYVSGQTSADPETGLPAPGGIEAETQMALDKMERVLKDAGCTKEQVVMCRVYILTADDWDVVNGVYSAFFGDHKPARSLVAAKTLPKNALVEIEVIALCD